MLYSEHSEGSLYPMKEIYASKWMKVFSNASTNDAEITIEGTIGWNPWDSEGEVVATKEKMRAELKFLKGIEANNIKVNINSYGGDVNHGISIHDLLAEHPAKITTSVQGHTASAATIIAMAGDTIEMSDNAMFLVHRASMLAWGNIYQMREAEADLNTIDKSIARVYAKRTGVNQSKHLDLMDANEGRGKWLNAKDSKKHGYIDNVYEPTKRIANFESTYFNFYNLPQIPTTMKKIKNVIELGNKINALINGKVTDDKNRETIIDEVADKAGVDAAGINAFIAGKFKKDDTKALKTVAEFFDTTLDAILDELNGEESSEEESNDDSVLQNLIITLTAQFPGAEANKIKKMAEKAVKDLNEEAVNTNSELQTQVTTMQTENTKLLKRITDLETAAGTAGANELILDAVPELDPDGGGSDGKSKNETSNEANAVSLQLYLESN